MFTFCRFLHYKPSLFISPIDSNYCYVYPTIMTSLQWCNLTIKLAIVTWRHKMAKDTCTMLNLCGCPWLIFHSIFQTFFKRDYIISAYFHFQTKWNSHFICADISVHCSWKHLLVDYMTIEFEYLWLFLIPSELQNVKLKKILHHCFCFFKLT